MDWLDIKEFIKDIFKYILFVVIVLVIAIYVIGLQQIVGDSMSPTYKDGDVLIIDKLSLRFISLKRGDIISFYDDESKYLVKRIIGLPGEYVEIKNNKIYINNEEITDYVSDINTDDFKLEDIGYSIIPKDMYFVLGDNRENSWDSRDFRLGLIDKKNIIGKKLVRLWPLIK